MACRPATSLALVVTLSTAAFLAAAPAGAVVMGNSSSLSAYTVRLVGRTYCTGVVISRRAIVTAAHCARGMRVMAGGEPIRIAGVARSAVLDDGRRVSVSGDAAILRLAEPLPYGIGIAPIGAGEGSTFTIAGYGTTDESAGASFGALHEATLVAAGARALVDPNRSGSIGASACFGDSGGPVMRGGVLVGVITRAAHPSPRIACGHLTRWAPVTVTGAPRALASTEEAYTQAEPRRHKRETRRGRDREVEPDSVSLFSSWFTEKIETRRTKQRKQAQR